MTFKGMLLALCGVAHVSGTAAAVPASSRGWGLSEGIDEPVILRQENSDWRTRRRGSGVGLIYFGNTRRHYGGGFGYGK
jgi:hypothetical protein